MPEPLNSNEALAVLASLESLSWAQQKLLASYSIGTVEELAGTLVADPSAVQHLLGLDHGGLDLLVREVQGVLHENAAFVAEFQRQQQQTFSLGAFNPG